MAKVLILMLGKGQAQLIENKGDKTISYRTANYIKPDDNTIEKTTAFVGEAIIDLYGNSKEKFDKAYILGTPDSMWQTLYGHCINEKIDDDEKYLELFEQIGDAIKDRTIDDVLLEEVGIEFSQLTNVTTTCKVIPLGINSNELWNIFETIVKIPNDKDEISIDITHGLRFQPFFLMLAIAYFQNVKSNVKIKNVFYGALELSSNFPVVDELNQPVYERNIDGSLKLFRKKPIPKVHSPIYDLKPLLDVLDWMKAANAFKKYGDMTDLVELLSPKNGNDNSKDEYKVFIKKTKNFIDDLQLNKLSTIRINAKHFINELDKILNTKNDLVKPINLVKDALLEFPQTIVKPQTTNWKILLQIAKRHKDNGQIGFAVLSTWEAVVTRIADVYGLDLKDNQNGYKYYLFCSNIAKKTDYKIRLNYKDKFPWVNLDLSNLNNQPLKITYWINIDDLNRKLYFYLNDFPQKAEELSEMRNAIAHLRGKGNYKIEDIPTNFLGKNGLFRYFRKNLSNNRFDVPKDIIKYKFS